MLWCEQTNRMKGMRVCLCYRILFVLSPSRSLSNVLFTLLMISLQGQCHTTAAGGKGHHFFLVEIWAANAKKAMRRKKNPWFISFEMAKWYKGITELKVVIIYSPLCCFRLVWCFFILCKTKGEMLQNVIALFFHLIKVNRDMNNISVI